MKSKISYRQVFRQCVGIDVSKSKSGTACLCMLSWGCPAIIYRINRVLPIQNLAQTSAGQWARREAEKGSPILFDGAYGNIL